MGGLGSVRGPDDFHGIYLRASVFVCVAWTPSPCDGMDFVSFTCGCRVGSLEGGVPRFIEILMVKDGDIFIPAFEKMQSC